jgi:predicted NBD/HSP70 family sugar kinase
VEANGQQWLNSGNGKIRRIDPAHMALASSEGLRNINRYRVLEIIRSMQSVSRADIARASGLQPSTVSEIVEQLLQEKWIKEGAIVRLPRGRRPTLLSLNDNLVILVADVHPHQAVVGLIDLNERLLAREVVPLATKPASAVDRIIECMQAIQEKNRDLSYEGIGLSVPGRLGPITEELVLAPNLKWGDYDIKHAVEQKMQLNVELANEASASLQSELWSGRLDGVQNAVLISISEGLGGAILANGHVVTGLGGLAGEFGHAPFDATGPTCGCGQRGCWETVASSNAALRYYAELAPTGRPPTIRELLHMAEEGDATAIAAVSKQCVALGRGLRLVTVILSPELILISGDIAASWDRFGPLVQAELKASMLAGPLPQLRITNDGELSRLRGVAAVVLQRHSGYNSSQRRSSWRRTPSSAPAPAFTSAGPAG